jgi:hypothetical protein
MKMQLNVFQYATKCEMWWRNFIADSLNPYTPITTFFSDLSIAEWFGEKSIRETYRDVLKSWGEDIKFMTEFSMCLNHKIWQFYEVNESIARVYDELWKKSVNYITNHFKGEDLVYYYEVTD